MTPPRYPSYKSSGHKLIAAIPSHWDLKRLRQVGRLLKGVGGSKEDVVDAGVPCVRYGDLYTTHAEVIETARTFVTSARSTAYTPIYHGDVLFAASGEKLEEIGKSAVSLIEGPARCGGDTIILRPERPTAPRFLGYALNASSAVAQKAAMGRGTTVKHIYPDELRTLALAVPPIDEQEAIANFLDRKTTVIDELITKKERLVALLQEKRRALIAQVVRGGLHRERASTHTSIPWLGSLPAAWRPLRLKHLSPRISGRLVYQPAQYFSDEGVPFVMGNNVTERGLSLSGAARIPLEVNEAFQRHALRTGDIVTVRVGAPGLTAVVPPEADGLNCGSLMIIRRSDSFHSPWLAHVMNSRVVRSQIEFVQYGAAQEQINIKDAVNFWVPTPPIEEQREIAAVLDEECSRIDRAFDALDAQQHKLREYRQALITAAVTGQIDVTKEHAA